jgi:hypothetical protein
MEGSAEVAPNSPGCLYSSLPSLFAHAAASREHNSSHAFNAASIGRQPLRMFFTHSLSRPYLSAMRNPSGARKTFTGVR